MLYRGFSDRRPLGVLDRALVDGYGVAAAFAAMAVSQVLAALVLIPVRLRRTVHAVPSHPKPCNLALGRRRATPWTAC